MTLTIITFSHDDDIVYYDVEHDAPLIVLWPKKAKKQKNTRRVSFSFYLVSLFSLFFVNFFLPFHFNYFGHI